MNSKGRAYNINAKDSNHIGSAYSENRKVYAPPRLSRKEPSPQ